MRVAVRLTSMVNSSSRLQAGSPTIAPRWTTESTSRTRIGHLLDMAKIAAANFQTRVADHLVNRVIAEDQQIEQSDVIALFQ